MTPNTALHPKITRGLPLLLIDVARLTATAAKIASGLIASSTAGLALRTVLGNPGRAEQALIDSPTSNNLMFLEEGKAAL